MERRSPVIPCDVEFALFDYYVSTIECGACQQWESIFANPEVVAGKFLCCEAAGLLESLLPNSPVVSPPPWRTQCLSENARSVGGMVPPPEVAIAS